MYKAMVVIFGVVVLLEESAADKYYFQKIAKFDVILPTEVCRKVLSTT